MLCRCVAAWLKCQTRYPDANLITDFDAGISIGRFEGRHSDTKDYLAIFIDLNCFTQLVNAWLHNNVVYLLKLCINCGCSISGSGYVDLLKRNFELRSIPVEAPFVRLILRDY